MFGSHTHTAVLSSVGRRTPHLWAFSVMAAVSTILFLIASSSGFAPSVTRPRHPRRACTIMQAGNDDLAKEFAAELANRRQSGFAEEAAPKEGERSFSGVREIILNEEGQPVSIPKRPPPAADTQSNAVGQLLSSPQFLFGALISIGSLVLLLMIAAADSAASA